MSLANPPSPRPPGPDPPRRNSGDKAARARSEGRDAPSDRVDPVADAHAAPANVGTGAQAPPGQPQPGPPVGPGAWRWVGRTGLAVVALLVLAILAIQVVLWGQKGTSRLLEGDGKGDCAMRSSGREDEM